MLVMFCDLCGETTGEHSQVVDVNGTYLDACQRCAVIVQIAVINDPPASTAQWN